MDINKTQKQTEEEQPLVDERLNDRKVYNFEELLEASGGFGRMQLY